MRTTRTLLLGAAATVALGLLASPAVAAPSGETDVTFEILAGTLDITVPATADLGTGSPGAPLDGPLGAVTVTDGRASDDASWEATVTATVFQTGGGTPPETILPSEIEYWSGPATATTGTGTFTPGQLTSAEAEPLDSVTPVVAFTHTGGTGNNTATWNPTLVVNVPLDSQAGVYTGTVTHSVA
ncbi:hypothetical protein I0C86_36215 [Plantactinospora sp. S1510]|uniref:WxL domain-containing protein n=1 Tax=Plantactinospora alkalitolerans TaxID=2789879 RepID=A0ABS0H782_9ACTN|nr:hypothetical protein [Plantactinospora alkalitolerans]MBF9134336.1 hypothetical protein [Plantactinospora alkalitolerans]